MACSSPFRNFAFEKKITSSLKLSILAKTLFNRSDQVRDNPSSLIPKNVAQPQREDLNPLLCIAEIGGVNKNVRYRHVLFWSCKYCTFSWVVGMGRRRIGHDNGLERRRIKMRGHLNASSYVPMHDGGG